MKKLLFISVFVFAFFSTKAAHIIGGNITYHCIGNNQYEFTMKIYRDCNGGGALFDSQPGAFTDATVTIYKDGDNFPFGTLTLGGPMIMTLVPDVSNPCLIIPDNVCVEEGIYTFTLNLPYSTQGYHVVYQRCCRNNSITNIINPGETGATYTVEVKPEAMSPSGGCINDSPYFNNFPPIIICANEPVDFDHSATDVDGDQLVYKFCSPKTGGGLQGTTGTTGQATDLNGVAPDPDSPPPHQNVTFIAPTYGSLNPMAGDPQVSINSSTGMITGVPTTLGQFVVGVCVEEYRNGQLLTTVSRDFQFNVESCEPTVFAKIQSDETVGNNEYIINSCGNDVITFVDESFDQQYINSYDWNFDLGNGNIFEATTTNTTVAFPGMGTYEGQLILNKGSMCDDTATIFVNIYPEINADFSFTYDTCVAGPVDFTNHSVSGSGNITDNLWNFGDGNTGTDENPNNYLYAAPGDIPVTLTVTDINGCVDDTTQIVNWYPVPPVLIIEPSTFQGCNPQYVFFNNLSTPIDETYDILWDFGEGGTSTEISPSYVYETPGIYDVSISVTSPIGCMISDFFPNWITVEESPVADFTYSPNQPSNFQPEVDFTDHSIDAAQWFWDFNGAGTSYETNPTYTFPDTGLQEITLIVTHPSGCMDTMIQFIDIIPKVAYFLPNAFTPNSDAVNDLFYGKGFFLGMKNFNMTIWNRWGELVFETGNPNEGWDGRKQNDGKESPNGVYVVVVSYTGPRGEGVVVKGFATLIK